MPKNAHDMHDISGQAMVAMQEVDDTHATSGEAMVVVPDAWCVDSGATKHMIPCREWFEEFPPSVGRFVTCANDTRQEVSSTGDILVRFPNGKSHFICHVWHVPGR